MKESILICSVASINAVGQLKVSERDSFGQSARSSHTIINH